jgi:hypothetical protein
MPPNMTIEVNRSFADRFHRFRLAIGAFQCGDGAVLVGLSVRWWLVGCVVGQV